MRRNAFIKVFAVLLLVSALPVLASAQTVSSPVIVVTHQNVVNSTEGYIDAPLSTFTVSGTRYWLHSNYKKHQEIRGALDSPWTTKMWTKTTAELFTNPYNADGEWWIVNTYQHPDGILAFIHVEEAEGTPSPGKGRIGLAWSTNNGDNFVYLGHIIKPYTDPFNHNIEGAPYIIKDNYFYVYYKDYGGIAVARALVSDVISAAKLGNATPWKKYYNGAWDSDALGGNFTPVGIQDGITHTDAAYSTYNGRYYMVTTMQNWGGQDTWIKLHESTDGLNWTIKKTIIQQNANAVRTGYQYASIVDVNGGDNGEVGQKFYVYCGKEPWEDNSVIYRWMIDLGTPNDFHRLSQEFSSIQGYNQWYYQYKVGNSFYNMTWDSVNNWWRGNETYLLNWNAGGHPGVNGDSAIKWVTPKSGTVQISGTTYDTSGECGDGVIVTILHNATSLWQESISNNDTAGKSHSITWPVTAGDAIYFVINKRADNYCDSTDWDPTIVYKTVSTSWTFSAGFSSTQGYNQWYYQYFNGGSYYNMTWDSVNNWWRGNETYLLIGNPWQHPGASSDSALMWMVPSAGSVRITGTVRDGDGSCGDGVTARILKNSTVVWGPWSIANGNATGMSHDVIVSVVMGDSIYFIVNKSGNNYCDSTHWDPMIIYQDVGNNPPNMPSNPNPANGATGVSAMPTLSWTGGDPDPGQTVTYDVYFGISATPPLVSSNQTATTYNPGTLNPSTAYYWQIVARDSQGETTSGPTWSFTTATGGGTFSISGQVMAGGGGSGPGGGTTPLPGVTMTLSGTTTATTTTNSNGNYTFTGLANGNYTVTPSLAGYVFSPTSRSVTVNGANVTGQNFTGVLSSSDY